MPIPILPAPFRGSFTGHHDTDEVLADAGFIVAAINHPGDTASDLSRSGDLSVFVERPTDIKRLIDFLIGGSVLASSARRPPVAVSREAADSPSRRAR